MTSSARRCRLVLALGLATSLLCAAGFAQPAEEGRKGSGGEERTLFVLLDAVPYSLLEALTDPELGEEALFRDLARPVPLISTFPSSTSVAAGGILAPFGMRRSPGYEARFFDWDEREVRGGGAISYFRIEFPWREFFDWNRKGVARSAFAALWPVRASISRLGEAVDSFFASENQEFFVYIETTDTAAHLHGPEALAPAFHELDAVLTEARARHPDVAYRVVLFSDHGISGGEPLVNTWKPAQEALRSAGFTLRARLRGPRDVALTPFGLVSSFEAYTMPESAEEVASLLGSVAGVDLCVHPAGKGWAIESDRGQAEIHVEEERWSYQPVSGDPLGYAPVVEELGRRAGSDAERGFPDAWWLEATGAHAYPDALYRLVRAFDLVENPASVLCSLEPGYMYGLGTTALGARIANGPLRWTHGALFREASWGFVLSDDPAWRQQTPVRFNQALLPFSGTR